VAISKGTRTRIRLPVTTAAGYSRRGKKSIKKSRTSWAILFWLAFAIFIFGLFIFNREAISNSIQTIQNEIAHRKAPGNTDHVSELDINPDEHFITVPPPVLQPQSSATLNPSQQPDTAPSQPSSQITPEVASQNTQTRQNPQAGQSSEAELRSAELRDRVLYFTQVDRSGAILRVKVDRRIPVSNSPMTDVIQALITGPSGEEKGKGLISLIPPGTRMLSATVRDNTAYISFSEDFQHNTYGVEGYAGQLRQLVYTVTEFPNVRDVQILIEGRRIDYLGEGIWIGSPLNREML
jgi:spore germination protein GerM